MSNVPARPMPQLEADLAHKLEIIAEHLTSAVDIALAAGDDLVEAKAQLPHGQWLPWLREHFPLGERTAQKWMQLARNPNRVALSEAGSIREALALMAPPRELERAEEVEGDDDRGDDDRGGEVKWATIDAEVARLLAPLVSIFREHEGQETDEPGVAVTVESYAEHLDLPEGLLRWALAPSRELESVGEPGLPAWVIAQDRALETEHDGASRQLLELRWRTIREEGYSIEEYAQETGLPESVVRLSVDAWDRYRRGGRPPSDRSPLVIEAITQLEATERDRRRLLLALVEADDLTPEEEADRTAYLESLRDDGEDVEALLDLARRDRDNGVEGRG